MQEITEQSTVRVHAAGARIPAAPASIWTPQRLLALILAYAAALLATIAVAGFYISPDRYFLILLVPALVLGVGRRYVADFLPFVALVMVYELLRGYGQVVNADVLGRGPFYEPMIAFDRLIGLGTTPPELLQRWLWTGHIRVFDQVVALVDHAHFFVPPTLLFIIWLERRDLFYVGVTALLVAAFAAAVLFFLFPAAPPWMAGAHHRIDVVSINAIQAHASSLPTGGSFIERQVPRNAVAAMPSLHAAFALLTWLIARRWRPTAGRIFLVYPLVMWFTIVYFGDHYVLDVVAGAVLALVAWRIATRLASPAGRLWRLAGPFPAPLEHARSFGGAAP